MSLFAEVCLESERARKSLASAAWETYNHGFSWGHEPTAKGLFEDGFFAASNVSAVLLYALQGLMIRHNDGSREGPWAEWDTAAEAIAKATAVCFAGGSPATDA